MWEVAVAAQEVANRLDYALSMGRIWMLTGRWVKGKPVVRLII